MFVVEIGDEIVLFFFEIGFGKEEVWKVIYKFIKIKNA